MTDFAARREARARALQALYELTVAQREPGGSLIPTPSLDKIATQSGLSYDQAADAMTYLVRHRYADDEETGPTYSLTPEGEEEAEGMLEAEPSVTSVSVEAMEPLLMDPALVVGLLKYVGEHARQGVGLPVPPVPGYSADLVAHHLKNMRTEGLIEGTTMLDGSWRLYPLPWAGQRFLEATQEDTPLRRALVKAGGVGGQMASTAFGAVVSRWLGGG